MMLVKLTPLDDSTNIFKATFFSKNKNKIQTQTQTVSTEKLRKTHYDNKVGQNNVGEIDAKKNFLL